MAESLDLLEKCSISMFTNESCGYLSLLPKERKMVHVRSKTRSLCQILEKPCVRSRGHIFRPNIMKLDQNLCLVKISDELENGLCEVKN